MVAETDGFFNPFSTPGSMAFRRGQQRGKWTATRIHRLPGASEGHFLGYLYSVLQNIQNNCVFCTGKHVSLCHFTQFCNVTNIFVEIPGAFMYNVPIRASFRMSAKGVKNHYVHC